VHLLKKQSATVRLQKKGSWLLVIPLSVV